MGKRNCLECSFLVEGTRDTRRNQTMVAGVGPLEQRHRDSIKRGKKQIFNVDGHGIGFALTCYLGVWAVDISKPAPDASSLLRRCSKFHRFSESNTKLIDRIVEDKKSKVEFWRFLIIALLAEAAVAAPFVILMFF